MVAPLSGLNVRKIVTPATADDGDTIDLSTLFSTEVCYASCLGATDGTLFADVSSNTTLTLPGTTDNEARTIYAVGY